MPRAHGPLKPVLHPPHRLATGAILRRAVAAFGAAPLPCVDAGMQRADIKPPIRPEVGRKVEVQMREPLILMPDGADDPMTEGLPQPNQRIRFPSAASAGGPVRSCRPAEPGNSPPQRPALPADTEADQQAVMIDALKASAARLSGAR